MAGTAAWAVPGVTVKPRTEAPTAARPAAETRWLRVSRVAATAATLLLATRSAPLATRSAAVAAMVLPVARAAVAAAPAVRVIRSTAVETVRFRVRRLKASMAGMGMTERVLFRLLARSRLPAKKAPDDLDGALRSRQLLAAGNCPGKGVTY
ncbi:protein of unknown function [Streptantibioticus cattleyicolor NRRL 8057 = DSM 46488]|nr:protein of unknown function [Streptantibioticus cattleyicolor NRRL 8057 = DSM 46488]